MQDREIFNPEGKIQLEETLNVHRWEDITNAAKVV